MKKLIFFSGVVFFGMTMMFTSCSQDDDLVDPVVEEVSDGNSLQEKSGMIQSRTFSTGSLDLWSQPFTNVSVNGRTTLIITITNTGSRTVYPRLWTTGYYNSIWNIPNINPNTSGTYSRSISGWTGNPHLEVQSYGGSSSCTVTIQAL